MSHYRPLQDPAVPEGLPRQVIRIMAIVGLTAYSMALTSEAHAVLIPVTNPSFEDPATANFSVGAPTGWSPFPAPGGLVTYFVVNETGRYPTGADDGDQAAQITISSTDPSDVGVLFQPLAATLLPDTVYTLSVALAVSTGDAGAGFSNGGALIELFADSGLTFLTGVTTPAVSTDGFWTTYTTSYTSPSAGPAIGSQLLIRLQANGNGVNFTSLAFDDVQLTAVPVPEPSTVLMASLGAVSIGLVGWRRKRSAVRKNTYANHVNQSGR